MKRPMVCALRISAAEHDNALPKSATLTNYADDGVRIFGRRKLRCARGV